MSRRSIKPPEESLETMILVYGSKKEDEAALKKIVDDYNKRIKSAMSSADLTEADAGGYHVTLSIVPKEDFNETAAIEILRKNLDSTQFNKVVKTREYIDDDALEDAVFNKQFDASLLNSCREPKAPTVTLRLSKAKNKEEKK